MIDFGTKQERKDALRIALACKELNEAIDAASFFVRVVDVHGGDPDTKSELIVEVMQRRTMILPSPASSKVTSNQCNTGEKK